MYIITCALYIYIIDYNNKVIPIVGRDVSRSPRRRGVPIVSVEDATRPAPRLTAPSPPPHHRPIQPKIDNLTTYLTSCFFGFAVYQIYNRVGQFVRARSERVWRWSDVWRSERTTLGKKPDVAVGQGKRNVTTYTVHRCMCVYVCIIYIFTFIAVQGPGLLCTEAKAGSYVLDMGKIGEVVRYVYAKNTRYSQTR